MIKERGMKEREMEGCMREGVKEKMDLGAGKGQSGQGIGLTFLTYSAKCSQCERIASLFKPA